MFVCSCFFFFLTLQKCNNISFELSCWRVVVESLDWLSVFINQKFDKVLQKIKNVEDCLFNFGLYFSLKFNFGLYFQLFNSLFMRCLFFYIFIFLLLYPFNFSWESALEKIVDWMCLDSVLMFQKKTNMFIPFSFHFFSNINS